MTDNCKWQLLLKMFYFLFNFNVVHLLLTGHNLKHVKIVNIGSSLVNILLSFVTYCTIKANLNL